MRWHSSFIPNNNFQDYELVFTIAYLVRKKLSLEMNAKFARNMEQNERKSPKFIGVAVIK